MAKIELFPVSHEELTTIIREVPNHTPVDISFGTGGTALQWDTDKPMPAAVELLGKLRGVWQEDGAGI